MTVHAYLVGLLWGVYTKKLSGGKHIKLMENGMWERPRAFTLGGVTFKRCCRVAGCTSLKCYHYWFFYFTGKLKKHRNLLISIS